jgi:hypothetical protein
MSGRIISVEEYGILPNCNEDCTRPLQKVLQSICEITEPVVLKFPRGVYHFHKEYALRRCYHTSNTNTLDYPKKSIGILLENQKGITIDGCGSLFLFHGNMMALAVVDSEDVVLQNFSWDYPCAPTSEMVIETVRGNRVIYSIPQKQTFEIYDNDIIWYEESPLSGERYWQFTNDEKCCNVMVCDEEKGIIGRHDLSESPYAHVETIKTIYDDGVSRPKLEIVYRRLLPSFYQSGVRFEFSRNTYRETAGAFFWQSKNIVVEQVNVHYLYSFGWLTQMCHNIRFTRCDFMPNEKSDRKCVSFADLIHVSGCSGQVLVEECTFSHAHDDAINIHGTFVKLKRIQNPKTMIFCYAHEQQGGFPQFYSNNEVKLYRDDTLEELATLLVETACFVGQPFGKQMEVSFQSEISREVLHILTQQTEQFGVVAENVTYTPSVIIKRCRFDLLPTRGILCTTGKVALLTGNVFTNITMASIFLSGDSKEWFESGVIKSMIIENNIFCQNNSVVGSKQPPAILIEPVTMAGCEEVPVHEDILIIGNTFSLPQSKSIVSERVRNLSIIGCTFAKQ